MQSHLSLKLSSHLYLRLDVFSKATQQQSECSTEMKVSRLAPVLGASLQSSGLHAEHCTHLVCNCNLEERHLLLLVAAGHSHCAVCTACRFCMQLLHAGAACCNYTVSNARCVAAVLYWLLSTSAAPTVANHKHTAADWLMSCCIPEAHTRAM